MSFSQNNTNNNNNQTIIRIGEHSVTYPHLFTLKLRIVHDKILKTNSIEAAIASLQEMQLEILRSLQATPSQIANSLATKSQLKAYLAKYLTTYEKLKTKFNTEMKGAQQFAPYYEELHPELIGVKEITVSLQEIHIAIYQTRKVKDAAVALDIPYWRLDILFKKEFTFIKAKKLKDLDPKRYKAMIPGYFPSEERYTEKISIMVVNRDGNSHEEELDPTGEAFNPSASASINVDENALNLGLNPLEEIIQRQTTSLTSTLIQEFLAPIETMGTRQPDSSEEPEEIEELELEESHFATNEISCLIATDETIIPQAVSSAEILSNPPENPYADNNLLVIEAEAVRDESNNPFLRDRERFSGYVTGTIKELMQAIQCISKNKSTKNRTFILKELGLAQNEFKHSEEEMKISFKSLVYLKEASVEQQLGDKFNESFTFQKRRHRSKNQTRTTTQTITTNAPEDQVSENHSSMASSHQDIPSPSEVDRLLTFLNAQTPLHSPHINLNLFPQEANQNISSSSEDPQIDAEQEQNDGEKDFHP